ncbi:tRNA epoxyqueuosine(34) reductase QueG [Abyssisolibacter fermentans]|uniref:tRNA epoxyqueuosine(34) reductase QueG n=1 Tax=Abyssisolibacter fermentans TaxID=1766203 RepID=UPI0008313FEC|nr:tRNA epoxyqueuosine(34) reductase QueG [Abyssisolibacter fermentans]
MNLKEYIIKKSNELSIDIVGFANTEPFERANEALIQRRDKNYSCEFEEANIKIRCNPRLYLENAKSFITIGLAYNNNYEINSKPNLPGKLSRTTWGMDYHKVLKNKLNELANEIKKVKTFNYKICVDTSPLIDREVAAISNIGWFGKNCSIINDTYGSFIFIGYLITDLDLDILDTNTNSKCGSCNLCIKACPTGALKGNYEFDANKCISYLTQTKNKIPYKLREKMGTSIYGCDICQLACPINHQAKLSKHTEFIPIKTSNFIDIKELLFMSKKEFEQKYSEMSGGWRGRNILRRNAIIALGNLKNKEGLELLKKTIKDPSPMIREYSAWSALRIDKNEGEKLILEHVNNEKDENVYKEIHKLISQK